MTATLTAPIRQTAGGDDRYCRLDAGAIREDLVRSVRAEIAAGTYDNDEKWDIALRRLSDSLSRR